MFSVFFVCFLQLFCAFVCCAPPRFAVPPCASGVYFHLCCCSCYIFTACAVVPGVSCPVCFVFPCFWCRVSGVVGAFSVFSSSLLPVWCRVFWLLLVCWLVCSGFIVWWELVRCLVCCVGVVCIVWCVFCFLFVFCLCWFWYVLVDPLFLVVVVLLVVWLCGFVRDFASCWCVLLLVARVCSSSGGSVLFWVVRCFGGCSAFLWLSWCWWFFVFWLIWCCSGCWCVSSPVRCTVLVVVDLGCFSSSWFFFLTFFATPGCGVASGLVVLFWFSVCCFVLLLFCVPSSWFVWFVLRTLGLCRLVRLFLVFPLGTVPLCLLLLLLVCFSRLVSGSCLVRLSALLLLVLFVLRVGVRVLVVFLCSWLFLGYDVELWGFLRLLFCVVQWLASSSCLFCFYSIFCGFPGFFVFFR